MLRQDITFISLIKLVHPDVGGPYSSHERAIQVVRHKDNPGKLIKLAESWGILDAKGCWEVKKRGLRIGDIITFTQYRKRLAIRREGLIVEIDKVGDKYVGTIINSDGVVWKLWEYQIKNLGVKFKTICPDMTVFTDKADIVAAGLICEV